MVSRSAFLRLVVAFFFLSVLKTEAAEPGLRVESIKLSSGYLTCNLVGENLFSAKALNFTAKGFTGVAEYTIELWKERGLWFDELIVSRKFLYYVDHPDVLSAEYKVTRLLGGVKTETVVGSLDNAAAMTQYVPGFRLIAAGKLSKSGLYYIIAWVRVRSLTAQNLEDVRRWLRDVKPGEEESESGSITSRLDNLIFKLASDFLISQNTLQTKGESRVFLARDLK